MVASVRDFVHDEAQERGWEGPGYGPGEEAHDAGTRPVAMWHHRCHTTCIATLTGHHQMSARDYFLDEAEEAGYDGPGYGPGADAEGHDAETASDREFIEIEEENPLCAAAQLEPCA